MNKEKFLELTIEQVSQVYLGRRNCCRCGCGGDYTSTSFADGPRSEVNDSLVAKRLKRAQDLVKQGADVDYGDTWIDVRTGQDRSLTFYIDDLKK
jgi:hypothetical protein